MRRRLSHYRRVDESLWHGRRVGSDKWQMKLTEESRAQMLKEAQAAPVDANAPHRRDETISQLREDLPWTDFADEVIGPLESQYQRFITHYREG